MTRLSRSIVLLLIILAFGEMLEARRGRKRGGKPKHGHGKERIKGIASLLSDLVRANPEKLCSIDVVGKLTISTTGTDSKTGVLNTEGAMCTETTNDATDYIAIDLGSVDRVEGIITQGHSNNDWYVTEYKVETSDDGTTYTAIKDENGLDKKFGGNVDNQTPVSNAFPEAVEKRYLRIVPVSIVGGEVYESRPIRL
uniref:lactadherin-like n=1 Tax=Styela clava TaxID=7725 RepID=UPI00193ABE49|nr:lactadherin-like [Styela clava]